MNKIKTEQLDLFPDIAPIRKQRPAVCIVCNRKISRGAIGAGCLKKVRRELKQHETALKDALKG